MAADQSPKARFESVTGTGDLLFSAGDQRFVVEVDDRLERALLEAKQVRAEHRLQPAAPSSRSLPISQIQSLVRAGADPEQVAQRYELSPALVRRFAAPVESERSYAIEQFLRVPAPKEAKVRSLAELIERTLAAARIRTDAVTWGATRRGLEPWRITASFTSSGHPIRAEWSWNMRDNSVVCINNAARKLIGESDAAGHDEVLDTVIPQSIQLPGDSARSARIEMAVSTWNRERDGESQPRDSQADATVIDRMALRTAPATQEAQDAQGPKAAEAAPAAAGSRPQPAAEVPERAPKARKEPDAGQPAAAEPAAQEHPATAHAGRSHRPPVPSWDEIMFGKAPGAK